MKRIVSLLLVIVLTVSLCACSKPTGDMSSTIVETEENTTIIQNENTSTSSTASVTTSLVTQSSDISSVAPDDDTSLVNNNSSVVSDTDNEQDDNKNKSAEPKVTICSQVADNIYIVGGVCSKNTEYINIGGEGVEASKTTPAKGESNNYFIAQVKISKNTSIEIQGKENGKDLSKAVFKYATTRTGMKNLMTENDYKPVFGLDSRMHFYSAILSYTKSDFISNAEKANAKNNISNTVSAAKNVGAEVIYLVVPSSAAVYPETLPSEYKKATGETLYSAFKSLAEESGAKVIYPLDIMTSHKSDGDGYKIYSHTDSHWTTYGAYWGVNALMSYISGKYPSAAPRTVQEMGFYTTELYGGDSLFSFGENSGFESYVLANTTNGKTTVTQIKEFTTLYNLKMPTDTLSVITRGKKSIYLTKDNQASKTETNPNGSGLPSAVIVRDSFGRTAYDMINDRFSKVVWRAENDYSSIENVIYENSPNYVIYIISERNLHKVMNNADSYLANRF